MISRRIRLDAESRVGNGVWCPASAGTYEAYAYHDNFDPNVNVFLEAVYHN